jgi:transposase-like protein
VAKYQKWLESENLTLLQGWARDGLTDEQIAKNMGIVTSTLYVWKNKYSEISEALKKGKEVVDREVENALLENAKGTTLTKTTIKMVKVDKDVLKARRFVYMKKLMANNPQMSKDEATLTAIAKVPTYEEQRLTIETKFAGETPAQIFWLKNRKPSEWRDRRDISGFVSTEATTLVDDVGGVNSGAKDD